MARQITTAYPIRWTMPSSTCDTHAALCNDGTLWVLNPVANQWELVPNVPQDTLTTAGVQGTYASPSTTTPISTAL